MAVWVAACAVLVPAVAAYAEDSAVVVMYHRFGETAYPTTNIRLPQFEAHLAELTGGKLNVRGLPEIVAALRAGRKLPDRTIGISIDDAYASVYTEAWPRLKAAKLPFTLFVATDAVDRGGRAFMTWEQIRELARAGVTIGSQTASHLQMPLSGVERSAADIVKSNNRFRAELGSAPKLFAYPYGEFGLEIGKVVKNSGFTAAFGQHSGVLHRDSNFMFLPRFAMNESYGDVSRFRLAANALPLKVKEITPADPLLRPADNPPRFGFTVFGDSLKNLRALACYASGQGKVRIERLGERRIEVRMKQAFPVGRLRLNCTMPAGKGRWRWFGMQFYVSRK